MPSIWAPEEGQFPWKWNLQEGNVHPISASANKGGGGHLSFSHPLFILAHPLISYALPQMYIFASIESPLSQISYRIAVKIFMAKGLKSSDKVEVEKPFGACLWI